MELFPALCVIGDRPTKRLMTITTWDFIVTCFFCVLRPMPIHIDQTRLTRTDGGGPHPESRRSFEQRAMKCWLSRRVREPSLGQALSLPSLLTVTPATVWGLGSNKCVIIDQCRNQRSLPVLFCKVSLTLNMMFEKIQYLVPLIMKSAE